ncbi:MAG TPA: M6 family metalloprotease domain-containing protein, partial [Gemmatimonadales bacterium]|nr:M6 family metalloprotease domain-containing protein [Gemmatimonadales bacterium]
RAKVRRIREARARMIAQGNFAALNAARSAPAGSALVLHDTLHVPALLMRFKNTDTTVLPFLGDTAQYTSSLFSSSPPFGRPYTIRTFYEQMTNGLFSMQGRVIGWAPLDSNEVFYTGGSACGGNCNGINSTHAVMRMQTALRETLVKMDATVDFGLFDNDGPDGIPNSGDDDGYVDMAMFVHPARDGACGSNPHLWSHRFVLVDTNSSGGYVYHDYITNDPWTGHPGQFIKVRDYFLTSGVGGSTACDSSQIIAIGTAAHESGHGLGLPDLYDTRGNSQGIGEWGLMGSGNYTSPLSPSRMEAWSLSQFGWVTLAPITTNGTYSFGPAPTSDSAWIVRPTGSNPRGEYYLLENRQGVQADSALIRIHGGGGLIIWHIDSEQVVNHGFRLDNQVNAGPIHGVRVEEADGLAQLMNGVNRGDGGDPYPGTSNNTVFSYNTNPANTKNVDGSFAGFAVDSIRQLSANGPMSFRLRFGGVSLVRATDSSAIVQFDSLNYNVFRGLLANASSHEVGVADTQFANTNRTRFRYQSWSDGLARNHAISGTFAGDTVIATLAKDFKTQIATVGTGSVSQSPAADATGFVPSGAPDTLIATPGGGLVFGGWTGDTTASIATLVLPMTRAYSVTATFSPALTISSGATRPNGVMGAAYYDTLKAAGGTGTYSWAVTAGALPNGVALSSGGVLSGYPQGTGASNYTATATSGAQQVSQAFSFSTTAPTLLTADVVNQLLTGASALTADGIRYLDYLGNNNGSFDVGDFLAWVNATGAPLAAPRPAVAARSRLPSRKGGRP